MCSSSCINLINLKPRSRKYEILQTRNRENNNTTDLQLATYKSVDRNYETQSTFHWRIHLNMIMNLQVTLKDECLYDFLSACYDLKEDTVL
jgi:ribosomal protein L5